MHNTAGLLAHVATSPRNLTVDSRDVFTTPHSHLFTLSMFVCSLLIDRKSIYNLQAICVLYFLTFTWQVKQIQKKETFSPAGNRYEVNNTARKNKLNLRARSKRYFSETK
jgi:hypothetical protein